MKYIDYRFSFLDYSFPNYPQFLSIKDIKFEYENELRITTIEDSYPEYDNDTMNFDKKIEIFSHRGEYIKVDLRELVQKIYLPQNSTNRFRNDIEQLLHSYDIDVPIIKTN